MPRLTDSAFPIKKPVINYHIIPINQSKLQDHTFRCMLNA